MVMRHPHPGRFVPPPDAAAVAIAALRRPSELWLLGGLLILYLLVYLLDVEALYGSMNLAGPIALMAILAWSCYRIVMQSPIAVWAPLFWFRLACATYYGFGALVPHIANEETRQSIFNLHYFNDELNLKVNIIYCCGIFFALLFSYIFLRGRIRPENFQKLSYHVEKSQFIFFAILFIAIGSGLRYTMVIPYTFGLTDTVLPGIFVTLSKAYYAGIYLLIAYGVKYNRKILPLTFVLVGIEIAVAIASFAKTELLLILIFSFLGFISGKASRTKIVIGASCVLFAFFTFQSLVGYGRDQLSQRYNSIAGAGLHERWAIVQTYLDGGGEASASARQGGLSRLSYVNVGAFVVDRYDAGNPGNTLRNAAAVFVPRILWPGKPIITQLGVDLNFQVYGRYGSSLGVGHFAETYWNFGWAGIVPFMTVLALILSVYTRVSMRIMARQDWLLLPVVFLGVNMGLRVDGHFVPDILGAAWIAICIGFGLVAARAVLGRLTSGRTAAGLRAAGSRRT